MTEKTANHLIKENSPYLLQHAYNPVDWRPWGNEALTLAGQQNRLLIISIGYAACHWCHVMEHESFEDQEVADQMNRSFISVKVDREERPDIDHIYMAAAYATSGRGGWPLNVIALPDQRPVFAGTYYSKQDWIYILKYFSDLYRTQPEEMKQMAAEIESGMKKQRHIPFPATTVVFDPSMILGITAVWYDDLDEENGGTHGAPKFPMPANISCLLKYGKLFLNLKLLKYVDLTLNRIAMGGIYDHVGGGFSRYSVDSRWHVPHFEKMLYDNAQLISVYSHAFAATGKYSFKKVVEDSIDFIDREMTDQAGLFYASLDADSEGTEGAFYAWKAEELHKYLGDDLKLFFDYYSCEEKGNWENGLNILRKSMDDADFAKKYSIAGDQLSAYIETSNRLLFTIRSNRVRPATDNKVLTSWNALIISALLDAGRVFGKTAWQKKALDAATFYRENLTLRQGKLWRNSQNGTCSISGFLDDYSFLIKAFLDAYQATFERTWLDAAELLVHEVMEHFTATDGLFFSFASHEEPGLIQETVELSDNVIPASNSQMAANLLVLGSLLDRNDYLGRSENMVKAMIPHIRRNPSFHANWASLLPDIIEGQTIVKITGNERLRLLKEFSGHYLPWVVFSGEQMADSDTTSMIFVCTGKSCLKPVETVQEALQLLEKP